MKFGSIWLLFILNVALRSKTSTQSSLRSETVEPLQSVLAEAHTLSFRSNHQIIKGLSAQAGFFLNNISFDRIFIDRRTGSQAEVKIKF
jgi:hypothetical protein